MQRRLLAHDDEIFIFLQLPADAVQRGNVLIHLPVDQRDQQRSSDFFHALQRLVIVVQIDQAHRQRLVVHLPQGDLQRRLVEQIQGDQITVISFGLNDITVFSHLAQGDLLQLGDKIAVLILDVKLDLVLPFPSRELIPGNRRKQRRDRLAVSLLLMNQPLKCDIGPDHLARFVQQRMRQLEIPQESSLDLPVLRGKTDQFIHDHRLIIKHHIKNDGNIKHDKNTEHDARPVIYEIDQDIHSHQ